MKTNQLPKDQRPAERIIADGVPNVSDLEALAVVVGDGKHAGALERAGALLAEFGSLRGVLMASPRDLRRAGLTTAAAARVVAGVELARRSLLQQIKESDVLANPGVARNYLKLKMRELEHEEFGCMFLNTQHEVLAIEDLFRGTIDSASVHPREVVKRALHYNAAAVIFYHNHPAGSHEPSKADVNITKDLKHSLALIDVRVLDHFVVGDRVTSFAERRLL